MSDSSFFFAQRIRFIYIYDDYRSYLSREVDNNFCSVAIVSKIKTYKSIITGAGGSSSVPVFIPVTQTNL